MPHTHMVSEFVEKLGSFYELVDEDEVENEKRAKLRAKLMPNGDIRKDPPTSRDSSPTNSSPNKSIPDSKTSLGKSTIAALAIRDRPLDISAGDG